MTFVPPVIGEQIKAELPTRHQGPWDWILGIAKRILEAKIDHKVLDPTGWWVWMGVSALYEFNFVALSKGQVSVSCVTGPDFSDITKITERGYIGNGYIMDVPVRDDPLGPPEMWRLADTEGRTLAYGTRP